MGMTEDSWDKARNNRARLMEALRISSLSAGNIVSEVVGKHVYTGDPLGHGIVGLNSAVDNGVEFDVYGGISRSRHRMWKANICITGPHAGLTLDNMKWAM